MTTLKNRVRELEKIEKNTEDVFVREFVDSSVVFDFREESCVVLVFSKENLVYFKPEFAKKVFLNSPEFQELYAEFRDEIVFDDGLFQ